MNAHVACVDGVELLMDYLEGALPADVAAAIDAHVAGCLRCVAFLASYQETPRILRAATLAETPPGLHESLLRFLADRRRDGDH
jgi:anti-sigma factor RsiW